MDTKSAYLVFFGLGGLGVGIAFATGGGLGVILGTLLAMIGAAGAVLVYKYGYYLIPYFLYHDENVLLMLDDYEITPSQEFIIKKTGDGEYYASGYLAINVFKSAVEMSDEQIVAYNKMYERLMASFKDIIKVGYLLHLVDTSDKKADLESKIEETQKLLKKEKSKAQPDPIKVDNYERKLMFWRHQVDRVVKGEKPLKVLLFAQITQRGGTRDEALAKVKSKVNEMRTLIANTLNCDVQPIKDKELVSFVQWDKLVPLTPEDLERRAEAE